MASGVGLSGLGSGRCKVALVDQFSACVENVTFGCVEKESRVTRLFEAKLRPPWVGSLGVWVSGGCHGRFQCGPVRDVVECGTDRHAANHTRTSCTCRTAPPKVCDSPHSSTRCPCSEHGCWRSVRCQPTDLCNAAVSGVGLGPRPGQESTEQASEAASKVAPKVVILTSLCFEPSTARRSFEKKDRLFDWYVLQFKMLGTLLRTLTLVGTTLPRYTMVTSRYLKYEAYLARLGTVVLPVRLVTPPAWGSRLHAGTFSKLRALSLTQFETVIFLDNDQQAVRNIDHLA